MNANIARGIRPMKKIVLQLAAVALFAAGCSVDATKLTCANSSECPSGYHCDIGTASAAGSFKCANGAPQAKTLAVDASKFFLVNRTGADGTLRSVISGDPGAVTSTPDFVGVRVIARQGGTDIADSPVVAGGAVLTFQLPQPLLQVELRVQDDSGHSVPVTGYNQQVEVNFLGKGVAGNANKAAVFDVTTNNDGLFPPATWLASGPGPGAGNTAQEFTPADTLDAGVVVASSSYTSIADIDLKPANSTNPTAITAGTFPGTPGSPIAWQPVISVPSTRPNSTPPGPRVAAGAASIFSGFNLFGGATDASGTPADPQGSFYQWLFYAGWTFTPAPSGQLPTARSGAAVGRSTFGGSCFFTGFPCDQDDFQIVVAGGQGATGAMTNEIQLFDRKTSFAADGSSTVSTSWRLVGALPFANAGVQSASGIVPFNAVVGGANTSQNYAGGMMIYGRAVTAANSAAQGCVLFGAAPINPGSAASPVPIQPNSASCAGAVFDGTTGGIGFRQGATLIADNGNPTTFYLFGGRKVVGGTPTLMNDIWKATIACPGAPAVCATTTTWTQISGGGVAGFPTPRAGAGGAMWNGGRLAIHGGTDANGTVNDLWEFDPGPPSGPAAGTNTWRQVNFDQTAGVLGPQPRVGFTMLGDLGQRQIFAIGGALGPSLTVTDQMWLTGREAGSKLLVKVPFSLPALDQATNLKLTVDAFGTTYEQVFIWDGTTWRFLTPGADSNGGSTGRIVESPLAPVPGFLQADGNVYLLFVQSIRRTFNDTGGFSFPVTIDRLKVTFDFK